MMVAVPLGRPGEDYLLSMMVLSHLVNLELLWSVFVFGVFGVVVLLISLFGGVVLISTGRCNCGTSYSFLFLPTLVGRTVFPFGLHLPLLDLSFCIRSLRQYCSRK